MGHSKLLSNAENKYQLVLEVARRAKIIKDEIGKTAVADTMKPIPTAIHDMMTDDLYALRPQDVAENLETELEGETAKAVQEPEAAEESAESEVTEEK